MLDLSPEKLLVLLIVGLLVLGPDKLPTAARTLATGLTRARRLAGNLTEPVHSGLAEPRRIVEEAVAESRAALAPSRLDLGRLLAPPADPGAGREAAAAQADPADPRRSRFGSATGAPDDPALN